MTENKQPKGEEDKKDRLRKEEIESSKLYKNKGTKDFDEEQLKPNYERLEDMLDRSYRDDKGGVHRDMPQVLEVPKHPDYHEYGTAMSQPLKTDSELLIELRLIHGKSLIELQSLQAENKTLKEAIKELTFSLAEVNQEKQSLQAYNGKLVEAAQDLVNHVNQFCERDLIGNLKSALSSFMDDNT